MVNSVDFGNRIKKIMDFHELTASTFAEKIGVQRSSISHILSGRNKPSLDFVLKVTDNFNTVDIYWLLYGKGSFPKNKTTPTIQPQKKELASTSLPSMLEKQLIEVENDPQKKIQRIVVFYADGTFEEYKN
jgi:transcriptional regulator with XRE-family HTH domain